MIQKFNDFPQAQIPDDFEILEVKLKHFLILKGSEKFDEFLKNGFTQNGPTINAVKRLSDGEVFRVGEEVCMEPRLNRSTGALTRIWISHDQMRADIGNLGIVIRDFYHPFKG